MIIFTDTIDGKQILLNPAHIICAVREGDKTRIIMSGLNDNGVSIGFTADIDITKLATQINTWHEQVYRT